MHGPDTIRRVRRYPLRSGFVIGAAATAAMAWSTMPAYAYLDPGAASFILQGLVGSIAASAAVIGGYWHRIKKAFGRVAMRKPHQPD